MRNCNGCSECCYLIEVPALRKGPCEDCEHQKENRCDIHETKPPECKNFECIWLHENIGFPDILAPKYIGIVVFPMNKNVIVFTERKHGSTETIFANTILEWIERGYEVRVYYKGELNRLYTLEDKEG